MPCCSLPLTRAPIRVALERPRRSWRKPPALSAGRALMAFLRITLPIISPAIGAGFVLVFLDTYEGTDRHPGARSHRAVDLATSVWVHTANLEYAAAAPYAALLILISGLPVYLLTTGRISALTDTHSPAGRHERKRRLPR